MTPYASVSHVPRAVVATRFRSMSDAAKDDLTQAAAMALWRALPEYDPARGPLLPYAYAKAMAGAAWEYRRQGRWSVENPGVVPEQSIAQLEFWPPWLLEKLQRRAREIGHALSITKREARKRLLRGYADARRAVAMEAA